MLECNELFVNFENLEGNEVDTILDQFQNRQSILLERFIALKALTETLKNQISTEKTLWQDELKETKLLEKQINENQKVSAENLVFKQDEYKMKLEIFKEFLFFSQASSNIQETLKKQHYQQWLSEIEKESNTELDKIRRSMAALKPLQEIAATWGSGDEHNDHKYDKLQKINQNIETPRVDDSSAEIIGEPQNYSQQSGDITERFSLISSD